MRNKIGIGHITLTLFLCSLLTVSCGKKEQAGVQAEPVYKDVLDKYCSQCHGVPANNDHTAEEWPNVVYRMIHHRKMEALSEPTEHELEEIIALLQSDERQP